MANVLYGNYCRTTLAADITAAATSITVADASALPTIAGGNWFYLVLVRLSDNAKEIVKVTAAAGNTLTVTRAKEDTTALAFSALDRAELWVTAATLDDKFGLYCLLASIVNNLTSGGTTVPLSAQQGVALKALVDACLTSANIYNGLDKAAGGFALDARQGKALNDLLVTCFLAANVYNGLDKAASGFALDARQGKVLGDRLILVDKRQTVLSGAAAAGAPDFLSDPGKTAVAACTVTPLVVTAAAGYDARGPVDYVGRFTADLTWDDGDITDSTTNYLYLDYDTGTGTWTTGASVLAPVYSHVAPTPTDGQHWFDLNAMKMYVYASSTGLWTDEVRVFVGECVANGSGDVTSSTEYAFRGHYDSGWFTVDTVSAHTWTKTHNIGMDDANLLIEGWVRESSSYKSEKIAGIADSIYGIGASLNRTTVTATAIGASQYVASPASVLLNSYSAVTGAPAQGGQMRLLVSRRW